MTPPILPADEKEICEAVAQAAGSQTRLQIAGGASKQIIGRPERETTALSTARLDRIVDYDPAELILSVQPGVRLADIEALVSQHNQMLAFEPFDFATVVGGAPHKSTIGGVVGAGMAGSRRLSAGGVRDHCLGFEAVNGLGQAFKAGGKVVKNVTGYDLPKLMAGAWGQLAVMTELTLKVLPRPQEVRTLAIKGLSGEAAQAVMTCAVSSPAAVAAASHVPLSGGQSAITALRLEGFAPSVDARQRMLQDMLKEFGQADVLADDEAVAHWTGVQTGARLPVQDRPVLWRISIPPAHWARLASALARLDGVCLLDWAGGLVWARMPVSASAEAVRQLADQQGGHAMLIDAPHEMRAAIPALHPEPPAIAALSRRVRAAFDPHGVFDPHRFAAP